MAAQSRPRLEQVGPEEPPLAGFFFFFLPLASTRTDSNEKARKVMSKAFYLKFKREEFRNRVAEAGRTVLIKVII